MSGEVGPAASRPVRRSGRPLRLHGICGSLRRGSLNRALLQAAVDHPPSDATITVLEIAHLPLYDADLDVPERLPDVVRDIRAEVAASDGLLIVTPEYNHAVPGGLANAIDWLSRPHGASPLAWLPAGVLSASPAGTGGARGQAVLKLMLDSTMSLTYPHPGFVLGRAREAIDAERGLHDEGTIRFLADYLDGFAAWADQHPRT